MGFYHSGHRSLQQRFGSTALADRLEDVTHRTQLTDDDRAFIASASFFFLATADGEGRPDCSYKGGAPGFVRIASADCIEFPDYDGNGQFRSLGNIAVNPNVGLLFITMDEKPRRLRVNGRAALVFDSDALAGFAGAQALVRVVPEHIFPNCPRYIHDIAGGVQSPYTPHPEATPLEPNWKSADAFKHVVPPRRT